MITAFAALADSLNPKFAASSKERNRNLQGGKNHLLR